MGLCFRQVIVVPILVEFKNKLRVEQKLGLQNVSCALTINLGSLLLPVQVLHVVSHEVSDFFVSFSGPSSWIALVDILLESLMVFCAV